MQEWGRIATECFGWSPGSIVKWIKQSEEKCVQYATVCVRKAGVWLFIYLLIFSKGNNVRIN